MKEIGKLETEGKKTKYKFEFKVYVNNDPTDTRYHITMRVLDGFMNYKGISNPSMYSSFLRALKNQKINSNTIPDKVIKEIEQEWMIIKL